jgi:beta-glucanase (GH16 family)
MLAHDAQTRRRCPIVIVGVIICLAAAMSAGDGVAFAATHGQERGARVQRARQPKRGKTCRSRSRTHPKVHSCGAAAARHPKHVPNRRLTNNPKPSARPATSKTATAAIVATTANAVTAGASAAATASTSTTGTASAVTSSDAKQTLATVGGPIGMAGAWSLEFDDEFSGSGLDTSKWSTGWFGSGITQAVDTTKEQDCYDPSQVGVSAGALTLRATAKAESCGAVTEPYAAGLVSTDGKFSYTYGAYEARVWVPGSGSTVADWPAVWADGQNWPDDGEIDVLEGLGGRSCFHFHYSGGGPGGCTTVAGAAAGWHTYGADWEPGSITYYYDGRKVWQESTGVTSQPMYLVLNLSVPRSAAATSAPQTMRVDYVRVWHHA